MKILLVDVDSKIPNLALMKLSTHHKAIGNDVEIMKLNKTYYPKKDDSVLINADIYDEVYVSIVFRKNKKAITVINCDDVYYGGVGYCLTTKLSDSIMLCEPDYSLYPENDTSYGFITRGCIRDCYFCVVPKKEGLIHQVNSVEEIIRHKKVKFLDNNILAFKGHKEILQELIDKKIKCQFNQGLDIRLLNHENALLLSKLNYINEYIFAFDNIKDEHLVNVKLELFKKYVTKDWRSKFFIYCHPDMDIGKDVVYRVEWCKRNKVLPYFMRDELCWKSDLNHFYIDLCAYCNQVSIFKKMNFEEFMLKRTNNKERQKSSTDLYYEKGKRRLFQERGTK